MRDISQLSQLGIGLNTGDYGSRITTFTRGLYVTSFKADQTIAVERVSETRGDKSIRRVTTPVVDQAVTISFPLDVGGAASAGPGDFLASVMGEDAATKSDIYYIHKFHVAAVSRPPQLNLWSDADPVRKEYTGFRAGSIKFTINGKEASITTEVSGICRDEEGSSAMTLSFSDQPILVASQASVFELGEGSVRNFENVEITIAGELEGIHPVGNSRHIRDLISKNPILITVALSGLNFIHEIEKDRFKTQDSVSFKLKIESDANHYILFNFPTCKYQSFEGPGISDTDINRISCGLIAIGDPDSTYIDIKNDYGYRYDNGLPIT